MQQKNEYLTKRELLKALHECKNTYSSFLDPEYQDYHVIVPSPDDITSELIAEVIHARANPRGKALPVILTPEQVVIRVMTHSHIPLDPDRKRKARNTDQSYAWTNFPPFKHFIVRDGVPVEVGRSHWEGGFQNGHFTLSKGKMSDRLAKMFMLLVERISRRPNYRGYSYLEEMQSNALVNLCHAGLQFDESKSDNPFAFYTTAVNHSFIRIINIEKKAQSMRDDMLIASGSAPSMTRQLEDEFGGAIKAPPKPKRATKTSKITVKDDQ